MAEQVLTEIDTAHQLRKQVSFAAELLEEQKWARAGEKLSAIKVSDKIIEQKERELVECIAHNYSKIKGVERELAGLQLQLRLTSGPKKSALELLRKKIELQNDKVVLARGKYQAVRKELEAAEEWLKGEEAVKDRLCQELNLLVQQSANAQLERLEQLTHRMELLNKGFMPPMEADPAVLAAALSAEAAHVSQTETAAGSVPATAPTSTDCTAKPQTEAAGAVASDRDSSGEPIGPANGPRPAGGLSTEQQRASTADAKGASARRRPEMSKAGQQRAADARARHVGLQKPRATTSLPTSTLRLSPTKSPPGQFSGFD